MSRMSVLSGRGRTEQSLPDVPVRASYRGGRRSQMALTPEFPASGLPLARRASEGARPPPSLARRANSEAGGRKWPSHLNSLPAAAAEPDQEEDAAREDVR